MPDQWKKLCEEILFGWEPQAVEIFERERRELWEKWANMFGVELGLIDGIPAGQGLVGVLSASQELQDRVRQISLCSFSPPSNVEETIEKGVINFLKKAKATVQLQRLLNNIQYHPSELNPEVRKHLIQRIRTNEHLKSVEKGELLILLGLEPEISSLKTKAERTLISKGWGFLNKFGEPEEFLSGLIQRIFIEILKVIGLEGRPARRLFREIVRPWLPDILRDDQSLRNTIQEIINEWEPLAQKQLSAYLEAGPELNSIARKLEIERSGRKALSDAIGSRLEKLYGSLKKKRHYQEIIAILARAWVAGLHLGKRFDKGEILVSFSEDLGYDREVFQNRFDEEVRKCGGP